MTHVLELTDDQLLILTRTVEYSLTGRKTLLERSSGHKLEHRQNLERTVSALEQILDLLKGTHAGTTADVDMNSDRTR